MDHAHEGDLNYQNRAEKGGVGEPDRAALYQNKQPQNRNHSQREKNHLNSVLHCSLAQMDSIAFTNPSAQAAGEHAFTRFLLLEPISIRSWESRAKRAIGPAS